MDHRHAVAYFVLLLIVAGLGGAWWRASRRWRAGRRAAIRFERERARRRADGDSAGAPHGS